MEKIKADAVKAGNLVPTPSGKRTHLFSVQFYNCCWSVGRGRGGEGVRKPDLYIEWAISDAKHAQVTLRSRNTIEEHVENMGIPEN